MSGIMGIYNLDDSLVERENLVKMVDILAHRGTDGSGIWVEDAVGFGHRMLWTTPESLQEKLPLVNRTGDIAITADCRIDNRQELISVFQFEDCPPYQITDSQLILAAYEKWGEQCPVHLLGDFAFAIWDKRLSKLFCARDHFGVKPFYYYLSSSVFIFATEIKAILCLSQVPRRLNEVKVAEHLGLIPSNATVTFYEDILRLPAAHTLTVSQAETQIVSYWSLNPDRELRLNSDQEYAETFCKIFTEAVRCRLRSAFPVGSMLSGGLDSSSITCVARKLLLENGCKLHTFSTIHEQVTECDERFYQDAVLAQGGLEPHRLNADEYSPLAELDRVLWHQDEAQGFGNLYANWLLYNSALSQGVRVILDGFDGDTTVSHGKGYLIELARAGRWLTLASQVRALSKNLNQPWIPAFIAWVRVYGLNPLLKQFWLLKVIQLLHRPKSKNHLADSSSILNSDFIRDDLERRNQKLEQPKTERENHYLRLIDPGEQNTLEKLNSAAAAFSMEVSFPFWDKRLVEFCLSLPPEQKLNQGWGRLVMRRAMEGILPKEVQWRGGKTDHSASFDYGLLSFERERLENVIMKNLEAIEKYVNLTALREAYHRYLAGTTATEAVTIWKVLSLALWLAKLELKPSSNSCKKSELDV